MTFKITADTNVRRDPAGVVRQLSHAQQPYKPTMPAALTAKASYTMTPRMLAEQYLRDASGVLQLTPSMTSNFAAAPSSGMTNAGVELRFKEEKTLENAVTVSYHQTVLGLPVWGAGVTVRIHGGEMAVLGAQNSVHYDVQLETPQPGAAFVPNAMTEEKVRQVLDLGADRQGLVINSTRSLVYRFDANDRIDPQIAIHDGPDDGTAFAGGRSGAFPHLTLPAVPSSIKDGTHYVVTEVMFTLPVEGWGPVNWRAFVEMESGAVLYLRALVSCARAFVFQSDPVSLSGQLLSASSPPLTLDNLRTKVDLLGLTPPATAGAPQQLLGDRVSLQDLEPPPRPMPVAGPPYEFTYPSASDHFAGCSAYHHCDAFFRLLEGMGIDVATYFNNTDFPIKVDPHARGGVVNAACHGNAQGNGIGPVVFGVARAGTNFGIAADVRVVLHELGHGVLWDHVNSPNFGFAHSPGDSLAVILHDPTSKAPDRFETFPFMKESANLSRRHDRLVSEGWAWGGSRDDTQYGSEQILSTTLFRVYRAAGGDSTSQAEKAWASRYVSYLILKGVSFLDVTSRDPDVYVSALTEADASTGLFEGHPGGAFSKVFRWSFEKQGLYQAPGAASPVTKEGLPPAVDVYIDDGRKGEYMPFLQDFQGDAEIWNRTSTDAGTTHQTPAIGVVNYAYVRVRNRGTKDAVEVTVRGFKSRAVGASVWPTDWKALTTPQLTAAVNVPPGGSVVVGPFTWTPEFVGERLLFGASAPGDRSNLETVTTGPIPNARLVPLDNNTAQRAV